MKKAGLQFGILLLIILGVWFALSRVDYNTSIEDSGLKPVPAEMEEKLGDMFTRQLLRKYGEVQHDSLQAVVQAMYQKICEAGDVDPESMQLYLLDSDTINAFVVPGGRIFIYRGMIEYSETPEELAGVIGHEIGHVTQNHVSRRLTREVGMAMAGSLLGLDAGSEVVMSVLRTFISSSYNRAEESEADMTAIEKMSDAGMDPVHLANLFFRLSAKSSSGPDILEWIQSHPNPRRRSNDILEWRDDYLEQSPDKKWETRLFDGDWQAFVRGEYP